MNLIDPAAPLSSLERGPGLQAELELELRVELSMESRPESSAEPSLEWPMEWRWASSTGASPDSPLVSLYRERLFRTLSGTGKTASLQMVACRKPL